MGPCKHHPGMCKGYWIARFYATVAELYLLTQLLKYSNIPTSLTAINLELNPWRHPARTTWIIPIKSEFKIAGKWTFPRTPLIIPPRDPQWKMRVWLASDKFDTWVFHIFRQSKINILYFMPRLTVLQVQRILSPPYNYLMKPIRVSVWGNRAVFTFNYMRSGSLVNDFKILRPENWRKLSLCMMLTVRNNVCILN